VDRLREKANASSVPIGLGFNRRFDPHFASVHERTQAGEIGQLEQLLLTSRDPAPAPNDYLAVSGGIFRDMAIHDFDMARFFIPEIVSVSAQGFNQFSQDIKELGDFDSTAITLRGSKDELVLISNSRHAAYGFRPAPGGVWQRGHVAGGKPHGPERPPLLASARWKRALPTKTSSSSGISIPTAWSLEEFLKAVRGEASRTPTFEDGRMALVLANAAAESAVTGQTVTL
jgi:myo-inositol 2-dehydrogenase/D-chiro-inositol 1-dehydrogenase